MGMSDLLQIHLIFQTQATLQDTVKLQQVHMSFPMANSDFWHDSNNLRVAEAHPSFNRELGCGREHSCYRRNTNRMHFNYKHPLYSINYMCSRCCIYFLLLTISGWSVIPPWVSPGVNALLSTCNLSFTRLLF